jgi:hypothetical protein
MPRKGRRVTRKIKKGGYYSFNGAVATGAADWQAKSEMGDHSISNRGGNAMYGRGRKGKGKKATKRRKMKGGGTYGGVSAMYLGDGERGLANAHGGTSRVFAGDSQGGAFNNYGAQPGSTWGNYKIHN